MKILGLDPGATTGYALIAINEKIPNISNAGECRDTTLSEIEPLFEQADIIVYETFLVDPKKAQKGAFNRSDMVAPRVIGVIQYLAKRYSKVLVAQSPALKPMGYGFANLKYVPKKPGMHTQDAVAHAIYHGVKADLCVPVRKK